MNLSPRALAFRLALWCGLLIWAIWKMQANPAGDLPPGADLPGVTATVLARPSTFIEPAARGGVIDPEALQRTLSAASAAAARCGAPGATITATVGPHGLARATVHAARVPATVAPASGPALVCLSAAVWALPWPAGDGEMEGETAGETAGETPGETPAAVGP